MKALAFLRRGLPVHVVSICDGSLAASYAVFRQLVQKAGPMAGPKLHMHVFDLTKSQEDFQAALTSLTRAAWGGAPFLVIADEVQSSGP